MSAGFVSAAVGLVWMLAVGVACELGVTWCDTLHGATRLVSLPLELFADLRTWIARIVGVHDHGDYLTGTTTAYGLLKTYDLLLFAIYCFVLGVTARKLAQLLVSLARDTK
jgi:hypothetical protein